MFLLVRLRVSILVAVGDLIEVDREAVEESAPAVPLAESDLVAGESESEGEAREGARETLADGVMEFCDLDALISSVSVPWERDPVPSFEAVSVSLLPPCEIEIDTEKEVEARSVSEDRLREEEIVLVSFVVSVSERSGGLVYLLPLTVNVAFVELESDGVSRERVGLSEGDQCEVAGDSEAL
jgi:hypothetical protein